MKRSETKALFEIIRSQAALLKAMTQMLEEPKDPEKLQPLFEDAILKLDKAIDTVAELPIEEDE